MSMKKDDESGLVTPVEQEQNQSALDEKLPEFDVIGTALNDV
ncbi:hypothetical protein SAMN05444673_4553 [Bacillus sp. OV166]|nr:hypothetical protein [Bacillus sp. OV166]SMQ81857.1 hypothetical protein SAMN05444673_4553 [Bacillus sp. OV166]